MSVEEGPKLYANKPKKAQIKQNQEQLKTMGVSSSPPPPPPSSSSAAAAASSTTGFQSSSSVPPSQPPKESFARRYKFLWPMLLTVNLAVGAYLFMRTKKKDIETEEGPTAPDSTTASATSPVVGKPLSPPVTAEPVAVTIREPIADAQQHQLFKWILEEKRKVKPKDPEEKKRIDEEKAILKEFIRAKSIPRI